MIFTTIDEKTFKNFAEKHPYKSFLQTPAIAHIREKSGWKSEYVAVKDNKKILGAALIVSRKAHFNKYEFYSPRGFLIDYKDYDVLSFFVNNLKKYVKEKNGYILRIDPYVIFKERDINGDIVKDGIDNTIVVNNLNKLGFVKSKNLEQVGWMFCLDYNKNEKELLKSMRSFTRRNINKGLKNSIYIKEASYEEIPLVKELLDATSERKGFKNRNINYFQNLYTEFKKDDEINFIIAEIHVDEYISNAKGELEKENNNLKKLIEMNSSEAKIKNTKEIINKLQNKIEDGKRLLQEKGKIIPLSAGIFLTYGNEVLYLFGGNIKEYMYLCAPYVVQWEMITRGLNNKKFKRYNFYGIPKDINKHPKDYGVYDFKKGFTGYVEELIGEYELPITWHYNLMKIINKLRGR